MKFLVLIILFCFYCEISAQTKQCGNILCQAKEFCDSATNICRPCSNICDENNHNYDALKCKYDCQDFLKGQDDVELNQLKVTVRQLQLKVTVLLSLVCILIIIIIAMVSVQIWKWKKANSVTLKSLQKMIFPKKSQNNTTNDGGASNGVAMNAQVGGKPDLRLDIPSPGTQSEHSPATMTTAISRVPAEDSIDYAYDNPAMSAASSPNRMEHTSK